MQKSLKPADIGKGRHAWGWGSRYGRKLLGISPFASLALSSFPSFFTNPSTFWKLSGMSWDTVMASLLYFWDWGWKQVPVPLGLSHAHRTSSRILLRELWPPVYRPQYSVRRLGFGYQSVCTIKGRIHKFPAAKSSTSQSIAIQPLTSSNSHIKKQLQWV